MKKAQWEHLLDLFKENCGRLTLADLLANGRIIGSKYTNRISDCRKHGYSIRCEESKVSPMSNVYILEGGSVESLPAALAAKPYVDKEGRMYFNFGAPL